MNICSHFFSKRVEALGVIVFFSFNLKEVEEDLLGYVSKKWLSLLLDIEKIPCGKILSKLCPKGCLSPTWFYSKDESGGKKSQ